MRNWLWIVSSIGITAGLVAAVVWWGLAEEDVKQSALSTNMSATESPYVARHVCIECHAEQAQDYHTSGHADTIRPAATSPVAQWLDGRTFDDPERPYSYEYHYDADDGLSVSIPRQFGDNAFPSRTLWVQGTMRSPSYL